MLKPYGPKDDEMKDYVYQHHSGSHRRERDDQVSVSRF